MLQEYVPQDKLNEVKRVLHGYNQGKPVQPISLPQALLDSAKAGNFDVQGYVFTAAAEQLRPARVVRIGLVQNKIILPTTAPFGAQKQVQPYLMVLGPL